MLESDALRRTALILVLAGLLWNLVEAGVSLWVGVQAGSVAMLAFGLDSIVELLAGGVLVWRLRAERDELKAEAAERRAQRLLGLSFFLLAAYILLHSGANLLGWLPEPQPKPCRRRYCGSKRHRDDWPLRGEDAHSHQDAVPFIEGGGHGKPVLRSSGPDHPGGSGAQQPILLVVGRSCLGLVSGSLLHQGGFGELFGSWT